MSDIEMYELTEEFQIVFHSHCHQFEESQIDDEQTFAARYATFMSHMHVVEANEKEMEIDRVFISELQGAYRDKIDQQDENEQYSYKEGPSRNNK